MSAAVGFFHPSSVTPHPLLKVLQCDVKSRVCCHRRTMRVQESAGAQMDETIGPEAFSLFHESHTRLRGAIKMFGHRGGKAFANMLG